MKATLALDLATRTGWALRRKDGSLLSGVQNNKPTSRDSRGMLFLRFEWWLEPMMEREEVGLIAYEQPHLRGGPPTEVLVGLVSIMQKIAAERAAEFTSCHSSTLKKFATGRGNARKPDMIRMANELWPEQGIVDDNQADALWLLAWIESQKPAEGPF